MSSFTDENESCEETTRDALEYAFAVSGINLSEGIVDEIADGFPDLDGFANVTECMRTRRDEGSNLYIVENCTPTLFNQIAQDAGISDLIKNTINASEIQTYKPGGSSIDTPLPA